MARYRYVRGRKPDLSGQRASILEALLAARQSGSDDRSSVVSALSSLRDAEAAPAPMIRIPIPSPTPRPSREPRVRPRGTGDGEEGGQGDVAPPDHSFDEPPKLSGKTLYPGTSWKGTHVTSGLGWGTRTAADMMAAPGTIVEAPESGVVEYFHPTGAQGGGSMLFRGDSGREYWLGHIANGLPAGTRVRKRKRVALVSADHAAPHLHIDWRQR